MTEHLVFAAILSVCTVAMIVASSFGTRRAPWVSQLSVIYAVQGAILAPLVLGVAVPFRVGVMEAIFGLLWLLIVARSHDRIAFRSAVTLTAGATVILLCGVALMLV